MARILGLGGESTVLIIEFLFRTNKIDRIWGGILSENKKARQTIEMVRFKKEGVLRDHYVVSGNGRKNDKVLYGLLLKEWKENKERFLNIIKNFKIKKLK